MSNRYSLTGFRTSPVRGGSPAAKRGHQSRISVKEGVPKQNIKVYKQKSSATRGKEAEPSQEFKHAFINLPSHLKNKYQFVSLQDYDTHNYAHGIRLV